MSVRLNRRGVTLPMTIIVIAVLAVSVAISYSRLSSERRITGDGAAQLDAFAVAQSGLSQYLGTRAAKPGASQDTTYTTIPGGTAVISLRMLRESTTTLLPAVYVITSKGTNSGAKRYDSRTPPAERTVATYALWTPAPFDLNAGVTSLTGVTANGNSSHYSGVDNCGAAATIPGVAVPNGAWNPQHPSVVDGIPDDAAVPMGTQGPAGTAKDEVAIDWAGIVAGTAFPADYVYPASGWPGAGSPGMADWPVTRVNGNLDMPGNGKGILVVTGNLTISGNKQWDGLILVGGTLTGNGNSTIYGGIITGLNVKLGMIVPDYDVGSGTKTWQYDSCALTRALGHVGSLERVRNGWVDTWPSY
jgi:hypothetical protein